MSLRNTPLAIGSLRGTIYDFEIVGDTLPMHQHEEATNHITIVARGSIRAHGNGWDKVLKSGDVVSWKPNDPHEFVALEANSRVVNIIHGIL